MFISIEEIREQLGRGVVKLHLGSFLPMADAALWLSSYPGRNVVREMFDGYELIRGELGDHPPPQHYVVERWDDGEDEDGLRHEGMAEYVSLDFLRAVAVKHGNVALASVIDEFHDVKEKVLSRAEAVESTSSSDAVASPWSLTKPIRFNGYTEHVYNLLVAMRREGALLPTAAEVLRRFVASPPADLEEVSHKGFKYRTATRTKTVDVQALGDAIGRMTGRKAPNGRRQVGAKAPR